MYDNLLGHCSGSSTPDFELTLTVNRDARKVDRACYEIRIQCQDMACAEIDTCGHEIFLVPEQYVLDSFAAPNNKRLFRNSFL